MVDFLFWLFFVYVFFICFYLFVFSMAGAFAGKLFILPPVASSKSNMYRKTAVLIPAYKEDRIIVDTVQKALLQSYPSALYDVIVIAHGLQEQTLSLLKALPIQVIEVHFEVGSKAKSLNHALNILPAYQSALILDADNIMGVDFLDKINRELNKGYLAVQGNRIAKNTNTSIALLDAISEATNNHILRKGHRALGLSAALIGSGMGFDYSFFKKNMARIDSIGEDKELELEILRQGISIQYVEEALIYDEKVQQISVFKSQRTRWIAAQVGCLQKYAYPAIQSLLQGSNIDFINKVLQTAFPPRILLVGFILVGMVAGLLTEDYPLLGLNASSFLLFSISIWLSVPRNLLIKLSYREVIRLPLLFAALLLTLQGIHRARRSFTVTPKNFAPS